MKMQYIEFINRPILNMEVLNIPREVENPIKKKVRKHEFIGFSNSRGL